MGVQVNPLAETTDGELMAADAKLGFDDNAAFRQKELFAKRDSSQEDPRSGCYVVLLTTLPVVGVTPCSHLVQAQRQRLAGTNVAGQLLLSAIWRMLAAASL